MSLLLHTFALSAVYAGTVSVVPLQPPKRIVSLAPSITETLFALGLEDRIVGVTKYCTYPQQAGNIEKVGGYMDANIEKIVSLHPDLVILSREHAMQGVYLERFGVSTLTIDNATCAGICSSFTSIGRHCLATRRADSLAGFFAANLAPAGPGTGAVRKPRILFCVGRDAPGAGMIKSVYVAGKKTFYDDLIRAAGGENAFPNAAPSYPCLSPEGILAGAPDVIIDVAPAMGQCACSLLVQDWRTMPRIPAVTRNMILCLSDDYATVPGPRLLLLLDDIRRMVRAAQQGGVR